MARNIELARERSPLMQPADRIVNANHIAHDADGENVGDHESFYQKLWSCCNCCNMSRQGCRWLREQHTAIRNQLGQVETWWRFGACLVLLAIFALVVWIYTMMWQPRSDYMSMDYRDGCVAVGDFPKDHRIQNFCKFKYNYVSLLNVKNVWVNNSVNFEINKPYHEDLLLACRNSEDHVIISMHDKNNQFYNGFSELYTNDMMDDGDVAIENQRKILRNYMENQVMVRGHYESNGQVMSSLTYDTWACGSEVPPDIKNCIHTYQSSSVDDREKLRCDVTSLDWSSKTGGRAHFYIGMVTYPETASYTINYVYDCSKIKRVIAYYICPPSSQQYWTEVYIPTLILSITLLFGIGAKIGFFIQILQYIVWGIVPEQVAAAAAVAAAQPNV
jgi:hypothetical protein